MAAIDFVAQQLPKHSHVISVQRDVDGTLRVTRDRDLSEVRIAVTDNHWLEVDDIEALLAERGLDAIVNPGHDRHYSGGAKAAGLGAGVAVLTFRELMAALGDERLTDYENPDLSYVIQTIPQHQRVEYVELLCERQVRVHRQDLPSVDLVVAGIYTLGVADVVEILGEHPDTNAILNLGAYRQYTPDAKARAIASGVGLFTFPELFGALHRDGDKFIHYRPASARE